MSSSHKALKSFKRSAKTRKRSGAGQGWCKRGAGRGSGRNCNISGRQDSRREWKSSHVTRENRIFKFKFQVVRVVDSVAPHRGVFFSGRDTKHLLGDCVSSSPPGQRPLARLHPRTAAKKNDTWLIEVWYFSKCNPPWFVSLLWRKWNWRSWRSLGGVSYVRRVRMKRI